MKLLLMNTTQGSKPCYDEDFDEKKKLKLGEVYSAEIKLMRNLEFHRKYFKLFSLAWEYQTERIQNHYQTMDNFRKSVEVTAGHYDLFFSRKLKEWVEVPRSISFEKMDNAEFQDLYDRVKTVLFAVFLTQVSEEEFMKNLVNF